MYKKGTLGYSDPCKIETNLNDEYDLDCWEEGHNHPCDSTNGNIRLYGGAYLGHSCDSWVIGGSNEIIDLIEDLQEILVKLNNFNKEKNEGNWTGGTVLDKGVLNELYYQKEKLK